MMVRKSLTSMATESNTSIPMNEESSDWSSEEEKEKVQSTFKPPPTIKISKQEKKDTKKRKRKRIITVCLTHCRYDVVRRIAQKFNYREVCEGESWNMYWTDLSITVDRCKEMKRFQKINHFPGISWIYVVISR